MSREDAKGEKRACAQTSGVSLIRERRDVSGSRLVSVPTDLFKACMLWIVPVFIFVERFHSVFDNKR